MIVGVEDDGTYTGADVFNEEQIQQIIHTYVNPPIHISCKDIKLVKNSCLNIGMIEIFGREKPYKIARTVSNLSQNDVFVRRGTITTKASPEDIINMYQSSRLNTEGKQYVQSAETHLGLQNYENAINAYGKAIDIAPCSDFLIGRGQAYLEFLRGYLKNNLSLDSPEVIAVIAGFFNATGIQNLQASKIKIIWEHRLDDVMELL